MFRFQQFSNVSFQALAISKLNHCQSTQSIQSNFVSDSIRFNSFQNPIRSDSNLNHSNFLFPIQSNRSGSIHSVRFDPIQFGSESDSVHSVRFDPIQFGSESDSIQIFESGKIFNPESDYRGLCGQYRWLRGQYRWLSGQVTLQVFLTHFASCQFRTGNLI